MPDTLRRFEVLFPLRFNDGRAVPPEWIGDAVKELVDRFGAASHETQRVGGQWREGGATFRDDLVRLVVETPDDADSRDWVRGFKARWEKKLQQLELRVVSHLIEVE